jgi:uncharacterized protein YfaT (DUF1175 family)
MLATQQHNLERQHDRIVLDRASVYHTSTAAREEDRMLVAKQNLKAKKRQQVALSRAVPKIIL